MQKLLIEELLICTHVQVYPGDEIMKEYAVRMGKEKIHTGVWWRKTSGKDSLEDRHVDLVVMLKCILKKLD